MEWYRVFCVVQGLGQVPWGEGARNARPLSKVVEILDQFHGDVV
jgi:hypothetical protein